MLEVIREIVIKWDPIELMDFAPLDEYDNECYLIFKEFAKKKESLDKIIYKVFKDSFGEVFQADLEKCMEVAAEIENRIC